MYRNQAQFYGGLIGLYPPPPSAISPQGCQGLWRLSCKRLSLNYVFLKVIQYSLHVDVYFQFQCVLFYTSSGYYQLIYLLRITRLHQLCKFFALKLKL